MRLSKVESRCRRTGSDQMDPECFIMKLERLEGQGYAGRGRNETALNIRNRDNKRRAERTNQPLCTHCKHGYHSFEDCWAPGGGGEHKRPNRFKPSQYANPKPADKERASLAARLEALEKRADALDKERAQLTSGSTSAIEISPATIDTSSSPASVLLFDFFSFFSDLSLAILEYEIQRLK